MLISIVLCTCTVTHTSTGERLRFAVANDTQLEKKLRVSHELQIEHMGESHDDGPSLSNGSGGWLSSTHRLDFVDHYLKSDDTRPLHLVRTFRDIDLQAKATISRGGSQMLPEKSHSGSQLDGKSVEFTWIESDQDWSRCFERVEAEEEVLAGLRGEFDLLALLPSGEVAVGDQWEVDLRRLREVLAPGGDLSIFPTSGSLFGRVTELGVGGDFADYLAVDCSGLVTATYRGIREIVADPADDSADDGVEQPAERAVPEDTVRVGVVEFSLQIASTVDRGALYRAAMPDSERREPARVDSVPIEWTLQGQGELLWDLDAGHFHSFSLSGKETFNASILKTLFVGGREQSKYAQQARYGGTLSFEVVAAAPVAVDDAALPAADPDKNAKKKNKKKRKK